MARCPVCGKYKKTKQEILDHIEEVHPMDIPKGYTSAMFYYASYHNGSIHGKCIVCKKPTPWREEAGKPARTCGSLKCKKILREQALSNMIKKNHVTTLLNDPKQQEKMLANRKISGTYIWSDHKHKFTYTGSYELAAIKFIDTVLNINPDGIEMPGPIIPYEYNGISKFWITDIYLEDFNLIIEIKDGGSNKNTHPGFAYNREIEKIKDDTMKHQNQYNYVKVTDRNIMQLIEVLAKIRDTQTDDDKNNKIIVINESIDNIPDNIYNDDAEILNETSTELPLDKSYWKLSNDIINNDSMANAINTINESADIIADNIINESAGAYVELFKRNSIISIIKHRVGQLKYITQKVTIENGIITIHGINFFRLKDNLREMYQEKKLYKIFEVKYKMIDQIMFERKEIHGYERHIESITAHEFFALELFKLFEELYQHYNYTPYAVISEQLYDKTWLRNIDNIEHKTFVDITELSQINPEFKLKDYQLEFIEQYPDLKDRLNLKGFILNFDQGLGKTLTACALALALHKEIIYIICPNSLKINWANEIKSYFKKYKNDNDYKSEVFIVNDSNYIYSSKTTRFIICNQESIPKIYDYIIDKNSMIIVDESQNFRSIGKRTTDLLNLQKLTKCDDILLMSGTPIKSTPNEISPALLLIDPLFTLDAAKIYNKCFNLDTIMASNIVKERFSKIMWRKTKSDVLDLPEKHIDALYLNINNKEKYLLSNVRKLIIDRFTELYAEKFKHNEELKNEFSKAVKKYSLATKSYTEQYLNYIQKTTNTSVNIDIHEITQDEYNNFLNIYVYPAITDYNELKRIKQLRTDYIEMKRSAMGKALGEILPVYRSELFTKLYIQNKKIIKDKIVNNKTKTIIFSSMVNVVNNIYDDMNQDKDLNIIKISRDDKDRAEKIAKFKEDDSIDVLISTSQLISTGFTLTEANQMFFFGTPWRSTDFEQACDRIYRIGQTNDVYIYNVLLDTGKRMNLSTRITNIMKWSEDMFGAMIGDLDDTNNNYDNQNIVNESACINNYDIIDRFSGMNTNNFSLILETSSKKDDIIPLTKDEYEYIHNNFPKTECSFKHCKKGYYCHTQRARSDYYKTVKDIPKSAVDFISSTS